MRRKYSDRQKAEALALYDAGLTLTELAEQTGIPDSTLSRWIKGTYGLSPDVPDLRELAKQTLADKFDTIAHAYVAQALKKDSIEKTSGYYAVKSAKEAAETARLLNGQPTSIVQNLTAKLQKDFPDVPEAELAQYASELVN